MALFGGKKSTSITNNRTELDELSVAQGSITGGGSNISIGKSPGAVVNVTDGGAFDFAALVADMGFDFGMEALDFAETAGYRQAVAFDSALETVERSTRSETRAAFEDIAKLAVGGFAIYWIVRAL